MAICQRCGGEVPPVRASTKLLGDVFACLCHACLNRFEGLQDRALGEEQAAAIAREKHFGSLAAAGRPASLEQWEAHEAELRDLWQQARALALEFVQFVGRPAPGDAPG